MPAHKKQTPEKYCEFCEKKLERKRLPNGDLEYLIHFNRRRYCDLKCFGKAEEAKPKTGKVGWMASHLRARKICRSGPCVRCVKPKASDVHHKDGDWQNNSPENLERICRSCHMKEHRPHGLCLVCGKPVKGLGYCDKHYQRFKKHGDPLAIKTNQHTQLFQSED